MGSKLVHVAQVIALSAATPAFADPTADELVKQAGEAYRAGKYDDAASALEKAYAIDKKPDTLFALAQAERLGGRCKDAIPHYKQVLEKMNDLNVAKLVQTNLSLCERERGTDQPVKPDGPAPQPQVITRVERHTDKLAVTLFATGTLAMGAGVGFYLSSLDNADAAKTARTIDDSNRLNDRADTQVTIALVAGGVGVGLATYAVVRWLSGGKESKSVAVIPGPGSVGVFARF